MREFKQLVMSVDDGKVADIIAKKIYTTFGASVQKQDSTSFEGYRLFIDETMDDKRIIRIIGFAQGVLDTLTKPLF